MSLRVEIQQALNRNSAENGSDTPDYVLACYLVDCLNAYDKAVAERERWYGRSGVRTPPFDSSLPYPEQSAP